MDLIALWVGRLVMFVSLVVGLVILLSTALDLFISYRRSSAAFIDFLKSPGGRKYIRRRDEEPSEGNPTWSSDKCD